MSPKREHVIELLRTMRLEDKLVYSSDYPHWDADEIDYLSTRLPSEWHDRVFFQNACRLYGWKVEDLSKPGHVAEKVG
jgi:predicted TIM-barrel fold metal-dependent hydrolase